MWIIRWIFKLLNPYFLFRNVTLNFNFCTIQVGWPNSHYTTFLMWNSFFPGTWFIMFIKSTSKNFPWVTVNIILVAKPSPYIWYERSPLLIKFFHWKFKRLFNVKKNITFLIRSRGFGDRYVYYIRCKWCHCLECY